MFTALTKNRDGKQSFIRVVAGECKTGPVFAAYWCERLLINVCVCFFWPDHSSPSFPFLFYRNIFEILSMSRFPEGCMYLLLFMKARPRPKHAPNINATQEKRLVQGKAIRLSFYVIFRISPWVTVIVQSWFYWGPWRSEKSSVQRRWC